MKPDILLVAPIMPQVMPAVDAMFNAHILYEAADGEALVARVAETVRAIATRAEVGADRALIARLPRLEIIACYGVGVDAIDLAAARDHGVVVTNTPDVLTEDVADMALALFLAVHRRVCEADRYVRAGAWANGAMRLTTRVGGRRLGIIGLGRIGRAVARRAAAFDLKIAYHGRHEQPDCGYRYYADAAALARDSDILVLTCPGGAATHHLVDAAVLDALGPDGVLINVARGSVVDEAALVAALQDGRLGGAGLDVFAAEPDVPGALCKMDNVVLQPHQASATIETRLAMADLVVDNLRAHFAGQPALTPIA